MMKKLAFLFILIGIIGMIFTAQDFFSRKVMEEEYYFAADDIEEIIIQSDVSNIRVFPTTSEEIKVKWKNTFSKSKGKDDIVTIDESTAKLHITIGRKSRFKLNLFGFDFLDKREIDVFLPKKTYA